MTYDVISYIYFCVAEDRSGFKIGVSMNPRKRASHLPEKIDMANSIQFGCYRTDAYRIEKSIHFLFNKKRLAKNKGDGYTEWFDFSAFDEIIEFVTNNQDKFKWISRSPIAESKVIINKQYKILKVPRQIIHIEHCITLLQYKYLLLLLNEYLDQHKHGELPDNNGFRYLPILKLSEYIGYKPSKSELRNSLLGLTNKNIDYDILNKGEKEISCCSRFVSEWTVTNSRISFRLPQFVEDMMRGLNKPRNILQHLNWDIFNQFSGKYEAVIYKLCRGYVGVRRTPYMSLDEFRKYMGLQPTEYIEFGDIGQLMIYRPCKTINESSVSDITVNPQIKRKGRKAIGVSFFVELIDKTIQPFNET